MVLSIGANHVAPVMAALENEANVLAIVSFDPPGPMQTPNHWHVVPRRSYNLTHPAIYSFQVTPAIEHAAFDYAALAAANGLDVTA